MPRFQSPATSYRLVSRILLSRPSAVLATLKESCERGFELYEEPHRSTRTALRVATVFGCSL